MRTRLVVTWLWAASSLLIGAGNLAAQSTAPAGGAAQADPTDLALVGNRFPPLKWAQMNEQQKTMMRHVLDGPRTAPNGPFNVMLRAPAMGDFAQELGAQVRFNSSLPAQLREMAILMAARHWTAHYEWNAHKAAALNAGLRPDIVAAIAAGERPNSMQPNEAALHRFCSELLETKRVGDDTFAAMKAAFGEQGMTEVIFTLGYYSMVSMLLNVDEHPLPSGVQPELKPLAH
ncbi:MAG TPA: carboxymuconolactone decarboxylase family protein [Gammaproteobacteria bacterium]|nr:carboxymuconolactone decarboxylase family protein [Gammaproteobacteria bacterium]